MSNKRRRSGSCCEPLSVHGSPLDADHAAVLAGAFEAAADPTRLRLLDLIARSDLGEACVCDLSAAFDLTGSTISHHLKRPIRDDIDALVRGLLDDLGVAPAQGSGR